MTLANVELDRGEVSLLLALVKARAAEIERMAQNLEEGEGMDLERHRALKTIRPQIEQMTILTLKLEGAARDAGR